jgi:hypothetical protein
VFTGIGGELACHAVARRAKAGSAKRAGIQKAKSKILKKFSPFLTLYFTTTYLFSAR